jgi:hypothetical protein
MVKLTISKEGVFRTLEAFIAIFITFTFLLVYIPSQRQLAFDDLPPNFLVDLRDNDDFRRCVMLENYTCINETVNVNIEDSYEFVINVSDDPYTVTHGLPNKRVYSNSIFLAGNTTSANKSIVRLYFWNRPAENDSG